MCTEHHARDVWHRLEVDGFPAIGAIAVGNLTALMVHGCVKAVEKRGAWNIARRRLQKCSQIVRFAVTTGLAQRNTVVDVRPSDVLKSRRKRNDTRVDAKDLPKLMHDIDAYTGGEHMCCTA